MSSIETKLGELDLAQEEEDDTTKCQVCGAINACDFPRGYKLVKEGGEVEVGGPTSNEGQKVIRQLDDLSEDDLRAIARRARFLQGQKGRPKCMCGSLLIGRFKEEGTCNKCQEAQKQMEKVAAAGAKKK